VPNEQLFVDSNNALNFHKRASAAGFRAKGGSTMIVYAKSKVAPPRFEMLAKLAVWMHQRWIISTPGTEPDGILLSMKYGRVVVPIGVKGVNTALTYFRKFPDNPRTGFVHKQFKADPIARLRSALPSSGSGSPFGVGERDLNSSIL
jgi:hypothetical protein